MPQQFPKRNDNAAGETLVISRTDDGFRVYSPAAPTKSYSVSGSPQAPTCTCPDFEHAAPGQHCKHIQAVLEQFNGSGQQPDPYEAQERRAIQEEGRQQPQNEAPAPANGGAQMLLKRSVSPDGRIDSLSVEFSCPVDHASVGEIRDRAAKTLALQAEIVESFLSRNGKDNGQRTDQGNGSNGGNGAVPAKLLTIGGINTKWGR